MVERVNASSRLLLAQPFFFHGGDEKINNANPGRPGAEHRNGVLVERNSRGIDGRKQGRGCYRRGPLNVVVEPAQPVAIALQQPRRVGAGEILPLQKDVWPAMLDGAHEGLDKIVVILSADALVLPADIDGIMQQRFVVSANVQQY